MLVTSAVTGAGLDQLRKLLTETVSERRATPARISADLDGIAAEFAPYAAEPAGEGADRPQAGGPAAEGAATADAAAVPPGAIARLVDAFARAAGVSAVAEALQSARELRAVDYVGWPIAWLADRLTGRDPMRKIRLGRLWAEVKSMTAGPSGAQQAEIDNALTKLARRDRPAAAEALVADDAGGRAVPGGPRSPGRSAPPWASRSPTRTRSCPGGG